MKRIMILLLSSSCFILATPQYAIKTTLVKNTNAKGQRYQVNLDENLEIKAISESREFEYTLNMKILAVCNNKATLEYLMNRTLPNPTSNTTPKQVEINTDLIQKIPCLTDDDATLWVQVDSEPTNASWCTIL